MHCLWQNKETTKLRLKCVPAKSYSSPSDWRCNETWPGWATSWPSFSATEPLSGEPASPRARSPDYKRLVHKPEQFISTILYEQVSWIFFLCRSNQWRWLKRSYQWMCWKEECSWRCKTGVSISGECHFCHHPDVSWPPPAGCQQC